MTLHTIIDSLVTGLLCGASAWIAWTIGAARAREAERKKFPLDLTVAQKIDAALASDEIRTLNMRDATIMVAATPGARMVLSTIFPVGAKYKTATVVTVERPKQTEGRIDAEGA